MIYRKLGRSELEVSAIGFGCMSLGGDQAHNERLILRALELGINYFDTADLYDQGRNEISLGQALAGRRASAIIATKVGNQWRPDGSGWDWNPRKAYIKKTVVESLRRLRTDYIDLYQLHGGTLDDPTNETIGAFEELQQAGHIRHYGISSIRPNVIDRWLARSGGAALDRRRRDARSRGMTSVMMQYSLLDRRPEEQCLDWLRQAGVGAVVRGGLARGLLADKPAAAYLDHDAGAVAAARQQLSQVPGEASAGQNALRFCLSSPAVTSVACGIRTLEQLEENAKTAQLPPLGPVELAALRTAVPASRYEAHRV